jgi:D-xylose 1-dehydrogenase (NADP+, D-xylono-1,5-lactone-forming)
MALRWGVISTGWVARTFINALRDSQEAQVVAVASRDEMRAAALATELDVPRAYGAYADLLADPQVEAVYIGLPNSLHAEWSIACARAGKHVLCEKPLATSRAEAETMFEAARDAGVWLMEAFMYRFHPQTLKVQELIAEGAIGDVRIIHSTFCFTVADPNNIRLSAGLAGGALMDVGCYPVNFARMVAGGAPQHVGAIAHWAPSGVDETLVATLEYPSSAVAQIACSLSASRIHSAQIIGSSGSIELDEAFTLPFDRPTHIRLRRGARGAEVEEIAIAPVNHYRLQAEAFERLVQAGHDTHGLPEMPLTETLDNLATIEALLLAAREIESGGHQMNEHTCSVCGGAVKPVVLIEDHGPAAGEQPAAVAPGQAHRSLGIVYNEHYPTEATACMLCGHIDLWVDPEWVASLK